MPNAAISMNKSAVIFRIFLAITLFSAAMCFPQQAWVSIFFFLIPLLQIINTYPVLSNQRLLVIFFLFTAVSLFLSTLWFGSAFPLDWLKIYDPILSAIILGSLWIGFILVLSLPLSLWGVLYASTHSLPLWYRPFFGAALWVALEQIRSYLVALAVYGPETLSGPHHTYYALAYTLSHVPLVRELLPVGGLPLGTFVVILLNIALFSLFQIRSWKNPSVLVPLFLSIFLVVGSAITLTILRTNDHEESISVSIIGTALPSATDRAEQDQKSRIGYDSASRIKKISDIIVLPENFNIPPIHEEIRHQFSGNPILVSSFSGKNYYNMYFLNLKNNAVAYTQKQLLMPLGEYRVSWIHSLLKLTNRSDWIALYEAPHQSATKSTGAHLYQHPYQNVIIGGTLCSENISPLLYRNLTGNGATLLINSTSLAPFHGSALLDRQILAINTARALENGRYLAVASNMGSSYVISDTGTLHSIMKPATKNLSLLEDTVETKQYLTPYVRFGDRVSPLSFIFVCITLLWKSSFSSKARNKRMLL